MRSRSAPASRSRRAATANPLSEQKPPPAPARAWCIPLDSEHALHCPRTAVCAARTKPLVDASTAVQMPSSQSSPPPASSVSPCGALSRTADRGRAPVLRLRSTRGWTVPRRGQGAAPATPQSNRPCAWCRRRMPRTRTPKSRRGAVASSGDGLRLGCSGSTVFSCSEDTERRAGGEDAFVAVPATSALRARRHLAASGQVAGAAARAARSRCQT
jgi:hypothetical protein